MSIDRRSLFIAGAGAMLAGRAAAQTSAEPSVPLKTTHPTYGVGGGALPYSQNEIVHAASGFFGVADEKIAGVIERAFQQQGQPTGYIAGNEGSGGLVVGLRYGSGELYMKHRRRTKVYWQGPSAGFDFGGNLSRVFTLCYALQDPAELFKRYPGVEGSIYVVAGFGLNYQKAGDVVLAPIRTGVGGRVNASVGYLDYSRTRHISPF
jgi:hypothetical protein